MIIFAHIIALSVGVVWTLKKHNKAVKRRNDLIDYQNHEIKRLRAKIKELDIVFGYPQSYSQVRKENK